jgi:hypothetical protein
MNKVFSLKGFFSIIAALVVLSYTSCDKDRSWEQMVQFYEESESLYEESVDSIVSFNKKFVGFVEANPGSESDRFYNPTRHNIDYAAAVHGFKFSNINVIVTIDDEWEGEEEYYY